MVSHLILLMRHLTPQYNLCNLIAVTRVLGMIALLVL